MAFRLLVTGSRAWTDEMAVYEAIYSAIARSGSERPFVLVHGDCPTGADLMAKTYVGALKTLLPELVEIEAHPAEWDKYGKAAGPKRNQEMVDLGADLCLAFLLPGSRGTVHCAAAADKAGIEVWRFHATK